MLIVSRKLKTYVRPEPVSLPEFEKFKEWCKSIGPDGLKPGWPKVLKLYLAIYGGSK